MFKVDKAFMHPYF